MEAGSGNSFLRRHTSLVCLPVLLALARSIDLHDFSFSLPHQDSYVHVVVGASQDPQETPQLFV